MVRSSERRLVKGVAVLRMLDIITSGVGRSLTGQWVRQSGLGCRVVAEPGGRLGGKSGPMTADCAVEPHGFCVGEAAPASASERFGGIRWLDTGMLNFPGSLIPEERI